MVRQLSNLELAAAATRWQLLEQFAEFLAGQGMGVSPAADALRYARYFHAMTEGEWSQVEEYRRSLGGTIALLAQPPSEDAPEVEVSRVAMQVRLLFGFAAQYTLEAAELVTDYLHEHLGYSGPEWDAVLGFLQSQEEKNRA